MIVRMTRLQRDWVCDVATPAHIEWLTRPSPPRQRVMIDVEMPAVGWRTLADLIPQHAFGPLGGRKKGSEPLGPALRRISRSLVRLEAHPAFKELALRGVHGEVFLAWGDSPYPILTREPSVLMPESHTVGGIVMTQWRREYRVREIALPAVLQPAAHLAFMPQLADPASSPSP